jgi:hypothetical protein
MIDGNLYGYNISMWENLDYISLLMLKTKETGITGKIWYLKTP